MKTVTIKLATVDDIRKLVDTVSTCPYDIELSSGSYTVDAKSIMGIFGLDLSKPIELTAYSDQCKELLDKIQAFVIS